MTNKYEIISIMKQFFNLLVCIESCTGGEEEEEDRIIEATIDDHSDELSISNFKSNTQYIYLCCSCYSRWSWSIRIRYFYCPNQIDNKCMYLSSLILIEILQFFSLFTQLVHYPRSMLLVFPLLIIFLVCHVITYRILIILHTIVVVTISPHIIVYAKVQFD
jgi:hypothetical protein